MSDDVARATLEAQLRELADRATQAPWMLERSAYEGDGGAAHYSIRTVEKMPDTPWSPRYIAWLTGALLSDMLPRFETKGQTHYCETCGHRVWRWREVGVEVREAAEARADAEHITAWHPARAIAALDVIAAAREWKDAPLGEACDSSPEERGALTKLFHAVQRWDETK